MSEDERKDYGSKLATISSGDDFSLTPRNWQELNQMAATLAASDMVPKDYQDKPANVIGAWMMGRELGIPTMWAIQNIAVINGRPSLFGDAGLALCQGHILWRDSDFKEWAEGGALYYDLKPGEAPPRSTGPEYQRDLKGINLDYVACCKVRRGQGEPYIARFGVRHAIQAGLWGKKGPWSGYPERMLQMRARWLALRDQFPDRLKGVYSAEEARDRDIVAEIVPPAALPSPDAENEPQTRTGAVAAKLSGKETASRDGRQELHDRIVAADSIEALDSLQKEIDAIGAKPLRKALADVAGKRRNELMMASATPPASEGTTSNQPPSHDEVAQMLRDAKTADDLAFARDCMNRFEKGTKERIALDNLAADASRRIK